MNSIKTELDQVRDLIANSVVDLNENFYGLSSDVNSQGELVENLAGQLKNLKQVLLLKIRCLILILQIMMMI